MNRMIVAGLLAVATVPMALPALAASKRAATGVADLDIAGIKLGMTPEQVRPALVRAGFTPRASDPDQDSWEARIAAEVAKRRLGTRSAARKVPMFTMASGPRGEHLETWYYAGPSGATASSIKFQIPANQMTGAAFYQGVLEKYGPPTHHGYGKDMLYCSAGERAGSCVTWGNKRKTYFHAESDSSFHSLYLTQGAEASDAYKAAFWAEVERRAPKDARPSF
ncbi:MAG: hypothetical protein ABIW83_07990 [Allosphingosinicella sp.]